MALLQPAELSPEEQRENELDRSFSGTIAPIEGFKPVRRVTALVVDILRRANNFFVTAGRGFEAIGINPKKFHLIMSPKIDGVDNPDFDPSKAGAVVPKIAEVIALLTCSEDEMDACDDDLNNLGKLRRQIMKVRTFDEVISAMPDVQAEFTKINRSTAVVESDEPTIAEGDAKKKPIRASVRAM